MKKIMFMLAAVACAAGLQAAQFSWGFTQVREGWADNTVKADGMAYLFLVGANGATEAAVASAISGATSAEGLATTLSGMAVDAQSMTAGAVGGESPSGIAATAPAQVFFAVISDEGYAYQGAALTLDTVQTLGATEVTFGSQKTASSASAAWTDVNGSSGGGGGDTPSDVPEPTSGLLMLVGLGALALRRRR